MQHHLVVGDLAAILTMLVRSRLKGCVLTYQLTDIGVWSKVKLHDVAPCVGNVCDLRGGVKARRIVHAPCLQL